MAADPTTQLRRPTGRGEFEIAIICALPLEADAVESLFDRYWGDDGPPYDKAAGDPNAYSVGAIGRHNVVLVYMPGMGKASATAVAVHCRNSFPNIRLALVVGVCGVVPSRPDGEERILGDVIISNGVVQYDFGRQYPEGFRPKDTLLDSLGRPNPEIRAVVAKLAGSRGRKQLQEKMARYLAVIQNEPALNAQYPGASHDKLFEGAYRHINDGKLCDECGCNGRLVQRRRLEQGNPQPVVHFGLIASGDTVLKSGEDRDRHAQQAGVIAFEMESAGVWDHFACVVIKGACDYADSHKTKAWQRYAAATAAACAKAFLDIWVPSRPGDQTTQHLPIGPWFLVPYPRNDKFVCRAAALERLREPPKGSSQFRVALFGLGGIGKTQIALEYAYWSQETHPAKSVFWVHGGNEARFRQSFDSIARECHIPGWDDPKADMLSLVKSWLERKEHGEWLMVVDNADDVEVFFQPSKSGNATLDQRLGRYIPECAHGSILVTTRNKQAGVKLTKGESPIEVGTMDEKESGQLLRVRLINHNTTSEKLANLSSRLEHLPLALIQAAAFIEENSLSIDDYLQLLDEGDQSVIERLSEEFETVGRDSDTPRAVAATWVLSFDQIQRQAPFAGELLSLMSFFDRQAIPRDFLVNFARRRSDTEQQGMGPLLEALGVLKAFSLVTEAESEGLDMHRLVQLVTRKWLVEKGSAGRFGGQALSTVSSCYLYGGKFENRAQCWAYLAHAKSVLKLDGSWSRDEKLARGSLLHSVAGLEDMEGHCHEAEVLQSEAVLIRTDVLGADHPNTLTSMSNLALTYKQQGRWKEAESLQVRVMEASSAVLGADHPSTLSGMTYLASTYRQQGRWKEAESLQIRVMETESTMLGTDHPSTLNSINNLALTYWEQGRWKEAESLQVRVIETRKTVLGADHPNTLTSMNNLALTYKQQGRWKEAESLQVRVMEASSAVLGADHPDSLRNINNLALMYREQGRWKEAESLLVRMIETKKTVLGADHPDTLISIANLALMYGDQGRWKEAESLQVQGLETKKKVLGADHPDTLISMNNLAHTWMSQGLSDKALTLMDECVQAQIRKLGPEHPNTQSSLASLQAWRTKY